MHTNHKQAPILVTGAHRSGTTWVGKTLEESPHVVYIHEPFNLNCRPGICSAPVEYWYPYINEGNSLNYFQAVKKTLNFQYNLKAELDSIQGVKDVARTVRDLCVFTYYRYVGEPRPLIKDPFALFSVQWFKEKFNTSNVILIRHPAAYVNSILKKGWSFPFEDWLAQKDLIDDFLQPYRQEIIVFANEEKPLIDQAILLWNSLHYVISKYQNQYNDWYFVRHEDLCREPLKRFSDLFNHLKIPWNPDVEDFIKFTTRHSDNNHSDGNSVFNIRRDSKETILVWKDRLDTYQIKYIKEKTEDIARLYYSDEDW